MSLGERERYFETSFPRPTKHGGPTDASNLALACFHCNRFNGSDIASLDPESGVLTPLFNPRSDAWSSHFQIEDGNIAPMTAIGRVTVAILRITCLRGWKFAENSRRKAFLIQAVEIVRSRDLVRAFGTRQGHAKGADAAAGCAGKLPCLISGHARSTRTRICGHRSRREPGARDFQLDRANAAKCGATIWLHSVKCEILGQANNLRRFVSVDWDGWSPFLFNGQIKPVQRVFPVAWRMRVGARHEKLRFGVPSPMRCLWVRIRTERI